MEIRRGNITAETGPERTEICNGRVRVSFNLVDGGYVQEFYAADHRGRFRLLLSSVHRNLIPSSEHRVCASPMIVGERVHLFTVTRDSLRMPYSEVRVVHHDDASVAVELSGNALGHKLKCTISLEDSSNVAHVVYEDEIQRSWSSPLIEYFMASYAFVPDGKPLPVGTQPDYVWVPNLRPAMDHVIGDCFFHAPAAIVRISRLAVAIVPDLRLLATHRPMPSCLDVDLTNGLLHAPLVSYGFCGYEQVHDANYCRHDLSHSRRLCENRLKFGFHLILDADCPAEAAHGQVSRFIWLNYGSRYFGKETKASSDSRSGLQDKPTIKARRTSYALFEHPDAQAACGMYAEGMRIGDNRLIDQARALKDLLLTSPQDKGLFPTRYDPVRKLWLGCQADIGGATYNTVECSTELYWLLEWHKRIEPDIRTVERAQSYADFLLAARQRSGAIPAWYGPDHIPLSPARSGSQTAPSALFLAQLAEVTEDPKYAQAAEHSARFVIRNLVPGRTYEDHNLLNPVNRTTLECTDPHTGARPVGGRSMLWIAFLLVELHR
ncbi:MAG: hypothetical protein N3B12_04435, partial [Armatimonadetes bacterium]|nr:hypothetical protein [Armatimonadota bacterium]